MAYDGWVQFDDTELINLSRVAQLSEALGISQVWPKPESVQWIQDELGGVNYSDITAAPWYDPGYPASTEFAGIVPMSIPALDDSTKTSTVTEYITDGGITGRPRNETLPMVVSAVIVASTDRGAEFGKRWMDRVLAGPGAPNMFCRGFDFTYFRYRGPDTNGVPKAHRRNVRLTRGARITRKDRRDCAVLWMVSFTLTAGDPFEYGEETLAVSGLGGPAAISADNRAYNPSLDLGMQGWESLNDGAFAPSLNSTTPISPPNSFRTTRVDPSDEVVSEVAIYPGSPSDLFSLFPVTPGESWTFQVDARVSNADRSVTLVPVNVDSNGDPISPGGFETYFLEAGVTKSLQAVHLVPPGTAYIGLQVLTSALFGLAELDETVDLDNLVLSPTLPQGSIALVQSECPAYDYTPIYDPLFPALVPSPTAPDFYPDGWNIFDGMTFDRFWVRVPPVEPSFTNVVPTIILESEEDARMVRVSIWSSDSDVDDQCDPLFSAVVSYLPAGMKFYIDGERQASYVWDGFSGAVRRADSLVYSPSAEPIQWTSFNDHDNLLITLDVFSDSSGEQGGGTVRASVAFTQKSD